MKGKKLHLWRKILLMGATKREREVCKELKQIGQDTLMNLVKSALPGLTSEEERIRAYSAGQIDAFWQVRCWIGERVFGEKQLHIWLPRSKCLITEEQEQEFFKIADKVWNGGYSNAYGEGWNKMERELMRLLPALGEKWIFSRI